MIRIVKHPHLDNIGIRDIVPFDSPFERTPMRVSASLLLAKPTDRFGTKERSFMTMRQIAYRRSNPDG